MNQATYARLRDGTWGIRVVSADARPLPGTKAAVVTKSGRTKAEVLGEAVWAGHGLPPETYITLLEIGPRKACIECGRQFTRQQAAPKGNWDEEYCGC